MLGAAYRVFAILGLRRMQVVKGHPWPPLLRTDGFADATGEVRRVLACRDYFEVLEISDRAWLSLAVDEAIVRRHYKTKSLLVRERARSCATSERPTAQTLLVALSGKIAGCSGLK